MVNFSSIIEKDKCGTALAGLSLLLVSAASFRLSDGILWDPFHHGEYFAALVTLLAGQPGVPPLTIHGALDFIPGWVALMFFGTDAYFFPTWLIYQVLNACAALVLLAIAFELTKEKPGRYPLLVAVAIAAPSIVGYRDVALLLSLYFYLLVQNRAGASSRLFLEACLGGTLAFGLFWSFDRGIAGAVSLGMACALQAYKTRLYSLSLAVFLVTAMSLGYISPLLSLQNYLGNVKVLVETASQWSYGWEARSVMLACFLGFSNILTIWLLLASVDRSTLSTTKFANLLVFIILSIFLFKIGSNRADMWHILITLWGPLLVILYCYSAGSGVELKAPLILASLLFFGSALVLYQYYGVVPFIPVVVAIGIAMVSILRLGNISSLAQKLIAVALVLPLVDAIETISDGWSSGQYGWMSYLLSPPSNSSLTTDGVRWASRELVASRSHCVFDLSNNGIINGLTGLPACSRFTYPAYATQRYEKEITDSLRNHRPTALVYSSTHGAFSIDGKSMHAKFPKLNEFLLSNYPEEKCSFGYCIRYLEDRVEGMGKQGFRTRMP